MTDSIRIHPHAAARMTERGASEQEVMATVQGGERNPAKLGRSSFRRNFPYDQVWRGKAYANKQVEAIAVPENGWLVLTVIVRFF